MTGSNSFGHCHPKPVAGWGTLPGTSQGNLWGSLRLLLAAVRAGPQYKDAAGLPKNPLLSRHGTTGG